MSDIRAKIAALAAVPIREPEQPNLTELGIAERLVQQHRDKILYCHPWGTWHVWDGKRWARDREGLLVEWTKAVIEKLTAEATSDSEAKAIKKLERDGAVRGAIALARSAVPVLPEQLDRDRGLLNTPTGTLDLRAGVVREHRREDLFTKLCPTPFDPDAQAPVFERFLLEIMDGDQTMVDYVARALGYGLTGSCSEHVMPLLIGTGANGKSTLTKAVRNTVGPDYALQLAPGLLFRTDRKDSHPTGLADLDGKRLAFTHELDSGTRLAEGVVKSITGGDPIKARRMRMDYYEFEPTHTVFLAANTRPVVHGTDEGIWRRLRLIPFRVVIPVERRDTGLDDRLAAEAPGILAWLVRGARAWGERGLADPQAVIEATAAYRGEQDVLGEFIEAECTIDPNVSTPGRELYNRFTDWWTRTHGGDPWTETTFGRRLTDRGIESKKRLGGTKHRMGIGLL